MFQRVCSGNLVFQVFVISSVLLSVDYLHKNYICISVLSLLHHKEPDTIASPFWYGHAFVSTQL